MLVAGVAGGMAWAAIPAFLRTRFHTNEILVSLMLVYVAQLLLSYLVHGPWRDPAGYNFPQSRMFGDAELLPILIEGTRVTWAFVLALALAGVVVVLLRRRPSPAFACRSRASRRPRPRTRDSAKSATSGSRCLISGAHRGPRRHVRSRRTDRPVAATVSPGYGFAAIIVAFVGRLHPLGIVLAGAADVAALSRRRSGADADCRCLPR